MIKANILPNGEIIADSNAVSDSINFDTIDFTFPPSWDGLSKTVVFSNAGKTVNVILDDTNSCYIPYEVNFEPEFTVSVFGIRDGVRATTARGKIKVLESGYKLGDAPQDPTPTEYEQIVLLMNETKQIAQSVRDDADSGALKGEKGDTGPQGEKGDKGDIGPQGPKGDAGKDATDRNRIFDYINYIVTGADPKAYITQCKDSISGEHVIPDFIEGYPVVGITEGAFYGCTGLTSITLPDALRSITEETFYGCTGLTSITLPDTLTAIWESAFAGCTGLKEVYYMGSEEQWAAISIDKGNEALLNADIHFNQRHATVADVIKIGSLGGPNVDLFDYYTKQEIDALVGEMGKLPSVGKFIGEVMIDNDETRLIEWTECDDGSPLDFDELFIVAEGGADTTRVLAFTTNNEYDCSAYNWSAFNIGGFNTQTKYITAHCRMIGGRWIALGITETTTVYVTNVQRGYNAAVRQGKQRCVNSLVIGLGWGHFTNGTKIAVYGR